MNAAVLSKHDLAAISEVLIETETEAEDVAPAAGTPAAGSGRKPAG